MTQAPVLLALTQEGAALAARLREALPGLELQGRDGRVEGADSAFAETTAQLRTLFEAGRPILAVCSAGIVIRALAPLLADKHAEPPVLALSEDGASVVPLLGGHRGANALAEAVTAALGGQAAVTTAGDRRWGVALDAAPEGWRLANPQDYKAFAAKLLAGAQVSLEGDLPWLAEAKLPLAEAAPLTLTATTAPESGGPERLVYHPRVLAVGVGCERGCDPAELLGLVRETLAANGLAEGAVGGVFSLDLKSDEPAVLALAETLEAPARFFDAAALEAEAPRLANPSDLVFREVGCHGVAEGAALAAAGPDGKLIVAKTKSRRATCAIALAQSPVSEAPGRPRGSLAVVGLGPGTPDWRTPEATALVGGATELVGYSLYLDLLGPLAEGKTRHDFPLGEETERVRHALALAAEGRAVALICSGDPGIYAMASLVFEQLEKATDSDWGRVAVTVAPGISALQAAAARAGAPLGHDFCAISLSDLLTPWPVIERRVKAASEGDFVVAFYNPVSRRRDTHLLRALEILRAHRPAETPLLFARNLGRPGESLQVQSIAEPLPAGLDMLTVVLVGSSETRRIARGDGGAWVYTPRGYAVKDTKAGEDAA